MGCQLGSRHSLWWKQHGKEDPARKACCPQTTSLCPLRFSQHPPLLPPSSPPPATVSVWQSNSSHKLTNSPGVHEEFLCFEHSHFYAREPHLPPCAQINCSSSTAASFASPSLSTQLQPSGEFSSHKSYILQVVCAVSWGRGRIVFFSLVFSLLLFCCAHGTAPSPIEWTSL